MKKLVSNPAPQESRSARAARQYFERSGIQTLAVIEKSEDNATADVSVYRREGGHAITVQLPVTDADYLEYGAEQLAYRFGDRPGVIYVDQELATNANA